MGGASHVHVVTGDCTICWGVGGVDTMGCSCDDKVSCVSGIAYTTGCGLTL